MSARESLRAFSQAMLEPLRLLWDALRTWKWQHSVAALLIGMFTLSNMGGAVFFPEGFAWARSLTYNVLQFGVPTVLWLRWADRATQRAGDPAWLSYGAGVPFVVCAGVWIFGPWLSLIIGGDANWNAKNDRMLASAVLVPITLVVAGYAYWQNSQRAQAALRAAHEAREAQAQALSAARLLALQARMEPHLLFDSLKRIRDAVGTDDAKADQMLLNLIALLRAMQPHVSARSSSLGRELALVEAFAKVTEKAALLPPRLRMEVDGEASRAALAPALLLPLLRTLTQSQPGEWRLRAQIASDVLEIELSLPDWVALDLSGFAQRLAEVHGQQARLQPTAGVGVQISLPAQLGADARSPASAFFEPFP